MLSSARDTNVCHCVCTTQLHLYITREGETLRLILRIISHHSMVGLKIR
jgi:hypothetical protein